MAMITYYFFLNETFLSSSSDFSEMSFDKKRPWKALLTLLTYIDRSKGSFDIPLGQCEWKIHNSSCIRLKYV